MNKKIKDNKILKFNDFILFEASGFGTAPFFKIKENDVIHYFFKIDADLEERKKERINFHLKFGHYSKNEHIDGPKNSYMVMEINEISTEEIEDLARDLRTPTEINNIKIKLTKREISRLYKQIAKCIIDYLDGEPKISRIYDELQTNIEFGEIDYNEYIKSIIHSYLNNTWSIQDTSNKNVKLLMR